MTGSAWNLSLGGVSDGDYGDDIISDHEQDAMEATALSVEELSHLFAEGVALIGFRASLGEGFQGLDLGPD